MILWLMIVEFANVHIVGERIHWTGDTEAFEYPGPTPYSPHALISE